MDDIIARHVTDLLWIRDELTGMDEMADPIMGAADFDDAVCIEMPGDLLVSTDGPYDMRLVMKSALIHAATDVIVKGGRPRFALDNLAGPMDDVRTMLKSIAYQSRAMRIPVLGGNTKVEDVPPTACITVIGDLLLSEPIRDSGAGAGDIIALMGEPIWGERDERIEKAKTLFGAWYKALEKVEISSAKDVTKGGLAAASHEMQQKSGRRFELDATPHHPGRNLDNFMIILKDDQCEELERICGDAGCPLLRIGRVL